MQKRAKKQLTKKKRKNMEKVKLKKQVLRDGVKVDDVQPPIPLSASKQPKAGSTSGKMDVQTLVYWSLSHRLPGFCIRRMRHSVQFSLM